MPPNYLGAKLFDEIGHFVAVTVVVPSDDGYQWPLVDRR